MKLEDVKILGFSKDELIDHSLLCHIEIKHLRNDCITYDEFKKVFDRVLSEFREYKQKDKDVEDEMILISKDSFRSKSLVNMNDDMVRVTLDMTKRQFMKLGTQYSLKTNKK